MTCTNKQFDLGEDEGEQRRQPKGGKCKRPGLHRRSFVKSPSEIHVEDLLDGVKTTGQRTPGRSIPSGKDLLPPIIFSMVSSITAGIRGTRASKWATFALDQVPPLAQRGPGWASGPDWSPYHFRRAQLPAGGLVCTYTEKFVTSTPHRWAKGSHGDPVEPHGCIHRSS